MKHLSNGHSKTSRSGSLISILSNGTNIGNGVLKNKPPEMSADNLKHIENAFTTNRDEYAQFEASMDSSAPTANINGEKKTTAFAPAGTTESE